MNFIVKILDKGVFGVLYLHCDLGQTAQNRIEQRLGKLKYLISIKMIKFVVINYSTKQVVAVINNRQSGGKIS